MTARVRIRAAKASDARFLAWVMLAASRSHAARGLWDHLLDGSSRERSALLTAYARTRPRHAGHYSRFRIATVNGVNAAAVSAYPAAEIPPEKNTAALVETLVHAGWSTARIDALFERARVWTRFELPEPNEGWMLEWVATVPRFRRQGVAQYLLMDALAAGAAAGHRRTEVRVAVGNHAAQAAYEGLGFQVRSTHVDVGLLASTGAAGVVRMVHATRPTAGFEGVDFGVPHEAPAAVRPVTRACSVTAA